MGEVQGARVTRSQLAADLRALGIGNDAQAAVMVHTRMSALGYVIGGAQTVIDALLDAAGGEATIVALTCWDDAPPYDQSVWDPAERELFIREAPAFDPRYSRAWRENGRIPEAIRTWPGAAHSPHPSGSFAAIGPRAQWLMGGQSLDEGYGEGSPVARLAECGGAVLLLGDLFENVTLLHYAEYRANAGPKAWIEYEAPVLIDGQRCWRRIRELDSDGGAFPYPHGEDDPDAFEVITKAALAAGIGTSGPVGSANAHLLPAQPLLDFAVTWLENEFPLTS